MDQQITNHLKDGEENQHQLLLFPVKCKQFNYAKLQEQTYKKLHFSNNVHRTKFIFLKTAVKAF